ncbi:MAG TPA: hypothetical protein VE172_24775 [Stackebrandtia sp.]|uniref:hypothetical protein n=1 Tax=Stackebrandtia sp. TaxID=2023065 RepID=UPI002D6D9F7B|nr:hypothetical protein [Stackebrandtia sp.]HZE42023.1 hypothetical protein [Stackebrandtia sp.]
MDPNEERRRKWAKRRAWRKAFCEGRSKRDRRPGTELYDGVEGRVVPDVIRGTAYPERTDRRDAGARFSTYGWEDEA